MKPTLMCFTLKRVRTGESSISTPFFVEKFVFSIRVGFPSREIFPGDLDGQWLSMALCLGRAALSVLKGG